MKKTKVAIIGLGYVGLPLACLCAERDLEVRGLEVDRAKAEKINKGQTSEGQPMARNDIR
jgi:UDP-N-acetyl-D-glucosamine dehydrogenase